LLVLPSPKTFEAAVAALLEVCFFGAFLCDKALPADVLDVLLVDLLLSVTKSDYEDINDVLELYNIKLYIDNKLYLNRWSPEDIALFKQKVSEYSKVVGQFMSNINDNNVVKYYEELFHGYINSFRV
jgi:hypothetical protein